MTKNGQNFVSDKISQFIKDGPQKGPQKGKKMPQKQAIAVALDVARRKGFKSSKNPNESVSIFDDFVHEDDVSPTALARPQSALERDQERERVRRRREQKRELQVRSSSQGRSRMRYAPKTRSGNLPGKLKKSPHFDPIARQQHRAGAGGEGPHSYRAPRRGYTGTGSRHVVTYKPPHNMQFADRSIFDNIISERKLTTRGRKQIKKSNFAIPSKAPGSGSYPIHDISHARNALARVAQHGSPTEKETVKSAVYKNYPELKKRKDEAMSIFDGIVGKNSSRSIFDGMVEHNSTKSIFDSIIESGQSKSVFDDIVENNVQKTESDNWDNCVARTLNLAEELIDLRTSIKV